MLTFKHYTNQLFAEFNFIPISNKNHNIYQNMYPMEQCTQLHRLYKSSSNYRPTPAGQLSNIFLLPESHMRRVGTGDLMLQTAADWNQHAEGVPRIEQGSDSSICPATSISNIVLHLQRMHA
jgi:hypothetical protein